MNAVTKKALIEFNEASQNLKKVMGELHHDAYWTLAYKFPLGSNAEDFARNVNDWVTTHTEGDN